jgi:hypothetical protein
MLFSAVHNLVFIDVISIRNGKVVCMCRKLSTNTVPAEFIMRTSISAALTGLAFSLLISLFAVLHLKNTSLALAVKYM